MTLSRFLRDYLYFSLGGNRKGNKRRYVNLMVTMLLGGLWHGAGWTFVIWGGLHGIYLAINHAWLGIRQRFAFTGGRMSTRCLAWLITFLAVVVGWVFFRSENFDTAVRMLYAMIGGDGIRVPGAWVNVLHWRIEELLRAVGVHFGRAGSHVPDLGGWLLILFSLVVAIAAPNTQTIMAHYWPALHGLNEKPAARWYSFMPRKIWATFTIFLLSAALTHGTAVSEFLYFQF